MNQESPLNTQSPHCSMSDPFFLPHATRLETNFPLQNTGIIAMGLNATSRPIVTSIVGEARPRPVPGQLESKNFRSDLSWEEIKELTIEYLNSKQIEFVVSYATYAFTIERTTNDSRLQIYINVYLEDSGTFIIEFKRLCGDLFTVGEIFTDLKYILADKMSLEELNNMRELESESNNDSNNDSNDNLKEYDFESLLY